MGILFQGFSSNVNSITLQLVGNGIDSILNVDLSDAPFNFSFGRNFPDSIFSSSITVSISGTVDNTFTLSPSINKSKLTLVFNKPLPANPSGSGIAELVSITFNYAGV